MSYFDIEGYQPQWLQGRRAITAAHGHRLHALVGRHLDHVWLVWDRDDDEWFADGPVVLDFDGEQVEINHQKFADLSVTWSTVDPTGQATWSNGDDEDPEVHTFHLAWRHDTRAELTALEGKRLQAVELLEWAGRDVAEGMVAVSFVFAEGRVTISNALDENCLEFGAPHPDYRSHPLAGPDWPRSGPDCTRM
ncbi:hypothetical protein ACQP1G_17065 [Nocardia sp. CA-107356]|uniref:hypothetical protein n=1 Tax=Nocardia sp. CA-107356 TaxID=3239972 RepID=UPI003D9498FD